MMLLFSTVDECCYFLSLMIYFVGVLLLMMYGTIVGRFVTPTISR